MNKNINFDSDKLKKQVDQNLLDLNPDLENDHGQIKICQ